MLESLRVVACLGRSPARWPRRTTVAAAFVAAGAWTPGPVAAVPDLPLAAVWCPIPGSIRPSAVAIFVLGGTAAVIEAPPTVHAVTAVAIAAPAPSSWSAVHAYTEGRKTADPSAFSHARNPDLEHSQASGY